MNVDPFLNNRVKLKVPEGVNDYINASPIVLKSSKTGTKRSFIATQVRLLLVTIVEGNMMRQVSC